MLYGILLFLLIVVSIFLIIFVLMQSDKGGGLAGSLGGMGGGMPFSGREAATILTKATTGLAITFMVLCVLLAVVRRDQANVSSNSSLQKRAQKMKTMESSAASSVLDQQLPAAPAQSAPAGAQGNGNTVTIPGVTQEPAAAPATK